MMDLQQWQGDPPGEAGARGPNSNRLAVVRLLGGAMGAAPLRAGNLALYSPLSSLLF